uniref:Uncharacterized protein n=1 Tax=Anguilla anguilla TaxID=7936 RepID=A0A0E9S9M2_ANGAN
MSIMVCRESGPTQRMCTYFSLCFSKDCRMVHCVGKCCIHSDTCAVGYPFQN